MLFHGAVVNLCYVLLTHLVYLEERKMKVNPVSTFCRDKHNRLKSVNSTWIIGGYKYECKIIGNKSVIFTHKDVRYKQIVQPWIYPSKASVYYFDRVLVISCKTDVPTNSPVRLQVNISEVIYKSSQHILVGGSINKSNKTFCAHCSYLSYRSPRHCYVIIASRPTFVLKPQELLFYPSNRDLNITCDLSLPEARQYYYGIRLVKLGNATQQKLANGQLIPGMVCFECIHENLETLGKCFKSVPVTIEIQPKDTKIYLPNKIMRISCIIGTPKLVNISNFGSVGFIHNNSTVAGTSPYLIIFDGRNDGTICFACGYALLVVVCRCYRYYDKKVMVTLVPNDTDIYFQKDSVNIFCIFHPSELVSQTLISQIQFFTNYSFNTYISATHILIKHVFFPYPVICARCGHHATGYSTKCYNPFGQYSIKIILHNLNIYFTNFANLVYCVLSPPNLTDHLNNIDFIYIGVNYTRASRRSIIFGPFANKSHGAVCFSCGHLITRNVTKCYKPYSRNPIIQIKPAESHIYFRYPNAISCMYFPLFLNQENVTFDIHGLEPKFYTNLSFLKKSLSNNLPNSSMNVCLVCGNTIIMNTSRCYNATNETVLLRIVPEVSLYMAYDNDTDIMCETNPMDASHQFTSLQFTKITSRFYTSINKKHVKICAMNRKCTETFCFTCDHTELPSVTRCYRPFDYFIKIEILPKETNLYFLYFNEITCIYSPRFAPDDQFTITVDGGLENLSFTKGANLSINIVQDIHLINTSICVLCFSNIVALKVRRCYNLKADVRLLYFPMELIFMVHYKNYTIDTFFEHHKTLYSTICKLVNGPSNVTTHLNTIFFDSNSRSGNYYFTFFLPGAAFESQLKLKVFNGLIQASITPDFDYLYYLHNHTIHCDYNPRFLDTKNINTWISGLSPKDYFMEDNSTIIIRPYIYLVMRKICVNFHYIPILNISRCYTLSANISFNYSPKKQYYFVKYFQYILKTSFTNPVLKTLPSECQFISGPMKPLHGQGIIFISEKVKTGLYTFRCYVINSQIYESMSLNVYSTSFNLLIYPFTPFLNLHENTNVFCNSTPFSVDDVVLSTNDTMSYRRIKGGVSLIESIGFVGRCLCFSCIYDVMSQTRCYPVQNHLEFLHFPLQSFYFAWSSQKIEVYFTNKYKPGKRYLALCGNDSNHYFTFEVGFIVANKDMPSGNYHLTCRIPSIKMKYIWDIIIYGPAVQLFITPIDVDMYIISKILDVSCVVIPTDLLLRLPDIRFTRVNSTNFQNISKRLIKIGGLNSTTDDIICVVCGHEYMPFNSSRCFSPYNGTIVVTITPAIYQLQVSQPHVITCRFKPNAIKYANVYFAVIGQQKESFSIDNKLRLTLTFDTTFIDKDICVICGNLTNMNGTRCYRVTGQLDNRLIKSAFTVLFMIALILLMLYGYSYVLV